MRNKPLLSVIVPLYNSKDTLDRCVESILGQTFRDLELILVDDGSTDGTETASDVYSTKYDRVRVIHQKNRGPLAARIAGCRMANGEYVSFVDSDDWLESCMFENLCQEIADADMLVAGIVKTTTDGRVKGYFLNPYPDGRYYLNDMRFLEDLFFRKDCLNSPGGGVLLVGPWSKIFRHKLIMKIIDKVDISVCESDDWLFNSLYVLQCRSLIISSSCYYYYCMNPNSVSYAINDNYLHHINSVYNIIKGSVENHPHKDVLLPQIQKKFQEDLLYTGMKMGFYSEAMMPVYKFPANSILKGKKVVLFGAGWIGKNYFVDWQRKNINVVMWIDNMPSNIKQFGLSPVYPKEINNIFFDFVVCAIRGKQAVESMKKQLLDLGVKEDKILWDEPIRIISDFF